MLASLERTRERMDELLGSSVPDVTVVLHRSEPFLGLAHPLYLLARASTAPAGRRYVAGWAGARELHVLSPAALARRASRAPGSRAMLALAPDALYARLVVARAGGALPPPHTPARAMRGILKGRSARTHACRNRVSDRVSWTDTASSPPIREVTSERE